MLCMCLSFLVLGILLDFFVLNGILICGYCPEHDEHREQWRSHLSGCDSDWVMIKVEQTH